MLIAKLSTDKNAYSSRIQTELTLADLFVC